MNHNVFNVLCNREIVATDSNDSQASSDDGEVQKMNKQGGKETKGRKEKKVKSKDAGNTMKSADTTMMSQEPQVPVHEKKLVLPERKRSPHQKLLIAPGGLWYNLVSMFGKLDRICTCQDNAS